MMPSLSDLPPPPEGRTGWPWTEGSAPLPPTRPDGSPWPRITIVTPSYNQGQYIEETIRSILLQGYPNLEYIVMDGGSTDATVRLLEKYGPWLAKWQSQSDDGQPDAINRGLKDATGVWFHNINSDDVLFPGTLARIGCQSVGSDMICGAVDEFSPDGSIWTVHNRAISVPNLLRPHSRSEKTSWHQPGVFLRTENLRSLGGYSCDFQYAFDFHLICRYVERFNTVTYLTEPFVRFRIHEAAKSSAWRPRYQAEAIAVRRRLASELLLEGNRTLANLEADRRTVARLISGAFDPRLRSEALAEAVGILKRQPKLLTDRMVLGCIRRMPFDWVKAGFLAR